MNGIFDWISEFEMQILIDAETNKDYSGQISHHDEHDTTHIQMEKVLYTVTLRSTMDHI